MEKKEEWWGDGEGKRSSAGEQPDLQEVPVLPQGEEEEGQEDSGGHAGAGLHERRNEVGHGGDKDQQHGHQGKDDVDELTQEGTGIGILYAL